MIPRPEIRDLLNRYYTCLAEDCDQMAPEVVVLVTKNFPVRTLPMLIIVDEVGNWRAGSRGATTPEKLRALLESALPGAG
jgi:hypothetical protein